MARICYPCEHFERQILRAEDVISQRLIRLPVDGETVREISHGMIRSAEESSPARLFIVHVEKGRMRVRVSVTAAA